MTARQVAAELEHLCSRGAQTISFITPDHFAPHAAMVIRRLRDNGVRQPIVINCSGYQSIATLRFLNEWSEVYVPDFKFAYSRLARSLADCPDYPTVALDAIGEMVRQKGYLRTGVDGVALEGVLVRHLMLPGEVRNSIMCVRMLAAEFGPDIPLSLMSQYVPAGDRLPSTMRRGLAPEEFAHVYREVRDLGFSLVYVQSPRWQSCRERLPDFVQSQPFPASLR